MSDRALHLIINCIFCINFTGKRIIEIKNNTVILQWAIIVITEFFYFDFILYSLVKYLKYFTYAEMYFCCESFDLKLFLFVFSKCISQHSCESNKKSEY